MSELAMSGHEPALLFVPDGEPRVRPVIVAAHGAGERPEPHCETWAKLAAERFFVACPRGRRLGGSAELYYFENHVALGREVTDILVALKARFGDRIDLEHAVYAGFSQGATMGVPLVTDGVARFRRIALVEGGYEEREWNLARATSFVHAGGERVLFVCGGSHCSQPAALAAYLLTRAGASTRIAHAPHAGHTYEGAVKERLAGEIGWLLEGYPGR
jgi:poly(3-hydroxybutyrate) depolymerase